MAYISKDLDRKVRQKAKNRCGYCLVPQSLAGTKLEIEHIRPKAKGGLTVEENLWLACRECNKAQQTFAIDPLTGKRVRLFNPGKQKWKLHFKFTQSGKWISGKTICGRATVQALKMNNSYLLEARDAWVFAGRFPPNE